MTGFEVVQLSTRSHRVHLVYRLPHGFSADTMCGRHIPEDRLLIGEHADIPRVRRCLQCSGWPRWEREKTIDLANQRAAALGTGTGWAGENTAVPTIYIGPVGMDLASERVRIMDPRTYVTAGSRYATEPRACACGDPKNPFWGHDPEECSWVGTSVT